MKNVLTLNFAARLMAVFLLLLAATAASAQDTNAPKTELDAFEDRTGIVIVKSVGDIGTITATGSVIVKCKESLDTSSGLKQQGLAITIAPNGDVKDTTVIDYDELDALLTALDYLTTVNWSVTTLSSFEALYTSRDGLRIAVHGNQRTLNDLGISLQSNRAMKVKISFTPDQLVQFRGLIQQGKAKLDALRDAK
jgi:hypothetical protein